VTTLDTDAPRAGAQPSNRPAAVTDGVGDPHRSLPDSPTATAWQHLRWAVRATLSLGVAASVAANILHALNNPISQAIAAWPPLALLLTVELISRVPVHRRLLAGIRLAATAATAAIAGIAAWVSYWHMAGVTARYGETGASAYLLPLSVDGLVVVASISLVEISARMHADTDTARPPQAWTRPDVHSSGPAAVVHLVAHAKHDAEPPEPIAADSKIRAAGPEPAAVRPSTTGNAAEPHDRTIEMPGDGIAAATRVEANESSLPGASVSLRTGGGESVSTATSNPTAAAVAYWRRRDPNMHPDDIAARIGRSSRQVRRYLQTFDAPAALQPDGRQQDRLADSTMPLL
jgi:uncharacterized protein DUF2637